MENNWWDGAAKLLSAGPLGLGAIIVLVTGFILITGNAVEQGRLKLSLSMLGSGCLLVIAGLGVLVLQSSFAQASLEKQVELAKSSVNHKIFFRIIPITIGSKPTLPPPIIMINDKTLDTNTFEITADTTAVIDVSDALQYAKDGEPKTETPADILEQVKKNKQQFAADIDTTASQIQRIAEIVNGSCPGGAHGVSPANYGSVLSLTKSVQESLFSVKQAVLNADL